MDLKNKVLRLDTSDFGPMVKRLLDMQEKNNVTKVFFGLRSVVTSKDILMEFQAARAETDDSEIIPPGQFDIRAAAVPDLEAIYQKNLKRAEHALGRLKDAGLYYRSVSDLKSGLLNMGGSASFLARFFECIDFFDIQPDNDEIEDDVWFAALDLTALYFAPEVFLSNQKYALAAKDHIYELYGILIMLKAATNKGCLTAGLLRTFEEKYGSLVEQSADSKKLILQIHRFEQMGSELAKQNAENERLSELLRSMADSHKEELAKVSAERRRAERELRPLTARMETAERELAQVKSERDAAIADANRLRAELDELKSYQIEPVEQAELLELPENVVFVGGHQNMLKYLRQRYPHWKYMSGDKCGDFQKADVVFVWYKHMNHSLFNSALSKAADVSVPYLYLSATNMDRLEFEMREAWTAYNQDSEG